MAKKTAKQTVKKPSAASSETTVTRITASDDKPKKNKSSSKAVVAKKSSDTPREKTAKQSRKNPVGGLFGYFSGAWRELRLVRWPDRRATWSMTGALIAFTLFFVVIILLLDALFQYLFTLVIK